MDDGIRGKADEASAEAGNPAGLEGPAVDTHMTIGLAFTLTLVRLGVVHEAKGNGKHQQRRGLQRRCRSPEMVVLMKVITYKPIPMDLQRGRRGHVHSVGRWWHPSRRDT